MSYSALLIDTCTIQRYSEGAASEYGNPELTWPTHLASEPCRIEPVSGIELVVGAVRVVAEYRLYLGDVDITERDRVVIDSVTYEILQVRDYKDAKDSHHKECYLVVSR